ncbi:hypothetical protein NTD84_10785 [Pseudomonas sp. 14P_8.1_Bac3]|uniref:hypothetical protein n=1 Tax=Pseudomonas sp. 14P_8.1_Bac3 TaxID=2971621 RepID=UPI0021CA7994|nr:hypothetical protein [Pseudomonas sp. 14P_8.1_Bac3]MCU1760194.1 hypothetical protein [Pseudomonas sp. 14P_8.1_Bac3]
MKTTFLMLSVVLASFTGCSNWSGKPNPHIVGPEGDKNLILKSGVFKSCMHFDNAKAGAEIAPIAAAFALSAIEKVSTLAVDKMVGALSEVAKNRNDAFPVDGKSVANMYRNEPAGVALQRCLVVVAGVQDSTSQLCENKDSDWYKQLTNMDACRNDEPVIESINGWGISKPAFYAEIVLYSPNDESPSYVVPKLVYLYYPEPLSSHAAKDLKSTIFTVSAAAPSNLTAPVFSFVYDAGQVSPSKSIKLAGTPEALKFADDPGVWTVVPSTLSALGNGAVNLTASLIETPKPNLLITQAEELLKEQEPMLKTELNSKVQYAFLSDTRNDVRQAELAKAEVDDNAALTSCVKLGEKITAAEGAARELTGGKPTVAHQSACVEYRSARRLASLAWVKSSFKRDALCFIDDNQELITGCGK